MLKSFSTIEVKVAYRSHLSPCNLIVEYPYYDFKFIAKLSRYTSLMTKNMKKMKYSMLYWVNLTLKTKNELKRKETMSLKQLEINPLL